MLAYVTVGANDMDRAERFYSAFLPALGYLLERYHGDLSYIPAGQTGAPDFYVKSPYDGGEASAGNGAMVAFRVSTQRQVRALHAAAVDAGGASDGAPGFRAAYGPWFYVGYLRDPCGNKVALFCDNEDQPMRPDRAAASGQ